MPGDAMAPVIIIGMGSVGRLVAEALMAFDIDYVALERDETRLRTATADGYRVAFGDSSDVRLWPAVALGERKVSVLTAPHYDTLKSTRDAIKLAYPSLKRFAYAINEADAGRLRHLDLIAVVDRTGLPGVALATAVLNEFDVTRADVEGWLRQRLHLRDVRLEAVAWGGLG
jgi:CPA2 family monovalent cation:H+ antiporter-2